MAKLVSIIIPCYNAERWVAEAIQSCLGQTYQPIEVIVIDDGSTDGSLEVIKSFGDKIHWETGPNRGGNHARNRGFTLSKGEYIQYLDADDYLLPEKIARQVAVLDGGKADVVYEDSQQFQESAAGDRNWESVTISGEHPDILGKFLTGWSPQPCVFLFSRRVVEAVGGWDESLTSCQDWELHIRLALAGVNYQYAPGCQTAARRPAVPTVSTRNQSRNFENIERVYESTEAKLIATGRLSDNYKRAMARVYFRMARSCFDADRARFQALLSKAQRLSPAYMNHESRLYGLLSKIFGVVGTEHFCSLRRRWQRP